MTVKKVDTTDYDILKKKIVICNRCSEKNLFLIRDN